jgi:hypothetical protein
MLDARPSDTVRTKGQASCSREGVQQDTFGARYGGLLSYLEPDPRERGW